MARSRHTGYDGFDSFTGGGNFGGSGSGSYSGRSSGGFGGSGFDSYSGGSFGGFGSSGNYGNYGSFGPENFGNIYASRGPGGTGGRRRKKKSRLPAVILSVCAVFLVLVAVLGIAGARRGAVSVKESFSGLQSVLTEKNGAAENAIRVSEPESSAVFAAGSTAVPETDPYDNDLYWYYGKLTDTEKIVYAEYVSAVQQRADSFEPSKSLTIAETEVVTRAVYNDHPELFWWQQDCTYWHTDDSVTEIELRYEFTAAELPAAQAAFDAAAQDILSQMSGLADYDLERIAHDTLCRIITYSYGTHNQTAYGALVDHECVCSGYARAMQYLMMQEGVPCYCITGQGYGGSDPDSKSWGAHAWNIICLQGAFYNLDVTYDDRDEWGNSVAWDESWGYDLSDIYCDYENYNLTDDEFSATHIADADCSGMPACTSTACSYSALYGESGFCGMLRQMGMTGWHTVSSLQDYYSVVGSELAGCGAGTYRLDFLVEGDDALQEICDATNSDAFWDTESRYISAPNGAEWSYWEMEDDGGESYLGLRITIK